MTVPKSYVRADSKMQLAVGAEILLREMHIKANILLLCCVVLDLIAHCAPQLLFPRVHVQLLFPR